MKEVICNIVQDLLPNYSEELTSPETSAVIEEHLETCNECRRLYEDYRKTVEVAKPEEVKANKRILRRIWFQSLWYMFWPCFYAIALMGGWENGALIFLATLSGLLVVALFQVPAYDMYFDDEKKGEYYKKEAGYLKRGEGNWLVRNLTWLLPVIVPLLVGVIPKLISLIMG